MKKKILVILFLLILGIVLFCLFSSKSSENVLQKDNLYQSGKLLGVIEQLLPKNEDTQQIIEELHSKEKAVNLGKLDVGIFYDQIQKVIQTYSNELAEIKNKEIEILAIPETYDPAASSHSYLIRDDWNLYEYELPEEYQFHLNQRLMVFCMDDTILDGYVTAKEIQLSNVYIENSSEKGIVYCLGSYSITFNWSKTTQVKGYDKLPGNIVTFNVCVNTLKKMEIFRERISGKLDRMEDSMLMVNGCIYPLSEDFNAYTLVGGIKQCDKESLCIGYDFTDFIIKDQCIVAAIVTRNEAMKNILVLIMNDSYGGYYHDQLDIVSDYDFIVDSKESITVPSGEMYHIGRDMDISIGERITIVPSVNTAFLRLPNLKRDIDVPEYNGKLIIERREEGYILINEILLEDYLCQVVPSEMPASYPSQALKAQAICARTYAYLHMLKPGLPEFGAHVDDSTNYQVYGNIGRFYTTDQAVSETMGILLMYQNEPAETYFYSTSCGNTTNAEVWGIGNREMYPYLKAVAVNEGKRTLIDEYSEEEFKEFITSVFPSDYEASEKLYRWKYEASLNQNTVIEDRMLERAVVTDGKIVLDGENRSTTWTKNDHLGEITNIEVIKRGAGGSVEEILISGTKSCAIIKGEYNIRYVLCDGVSPVISHLGDEVTMDKILPSSFISIETKQDQYVIFGGGYGHGIGMSQNGAKNMALNNCDYDSILDFFYNGTTRYNIYTNTEQ